MKNFKNLLENITKPVIRKNGFVTPQVIFEWQNIVGENLAKYTTPFKVTYPAKKNNMGTLHIEVIGAQAPIIQQLEPEIIERIAVFFGFKAIAKIKLVHTKELEKEVITVKKAELSANSRLKLDKMVEGIEDEELKKRLISIGENILKD